MQIWKDYLCRFASDLPSFLTIQVLIRRRDISISDPMARRVLFDGGGVLGRCYWAIVVEESEIGLGFEMKVLKPLSIVLYSTLN